MSKDAGIPHGTEVVLPCEDLDATSTFFVDRLGLRLEVISPADAPRTARLSGHGVVLRLDRTYDGSAGRLRMRRDDMDPGELVAPNGTVIEIVDPAAPLVIPELVPRLTVSRASEGEWGEGRAGMRYRDLIPDRQGGRFIASHIQISDGGPVPDYVHYHDVRFQMIYCVRGWVRVVYEDQGEPIVLEEGGCFLQPPKIRHRVLESSAGLEVVEIACPAEHDTFVEHAITLPTPVLRPDRDFSGQRFVFHDARGASWKPAAEPGFEVRDTGIADATSGVAGVRVLRRTAAAVEPALRAHDGELRFLFVLRGSLVVDGDEPLTLGEGDSVVVPPHRPHALSAEPGVEVLEVTLP